MFNEDYGSMYENKIRLYATNIKEFEELQEEAVKLCSELKEVINKISYFSIDIEIVKGDDTNI